ncbi:MAG: HNH endonuclease [Actinomycetales bacterium]|nr:HNH endonuclease [Actinomycetales bacterium]
MTVVAAGPSAPWAWSERHPVAAELEARSASVGLVSRLVELDPAVVDDAALVEGIAGWERAGAWVAGRQARWVAELGARAVRGSEVDRVPDEVAARLAITRRAAEHKVELALGLQRHPRLAAALEEGSVSARKVEVLVHDTEHLPRALADEVIARVLETADERTVPQLRADVRATELALDAEAAAARHAVARRERCVRMTPAPDAMAWIRALLPAADAAAVMTALDGAAAAREPGEERTADQRRADALTAMARRVLDSGLGPDGVPLPVRQHRRPHLLLTVAGECGGAGSGRGSAGVGAARAAVTAGDACVGAVGACVGAGDACVGAGPAAQVAHLAGYGPVPLAAVAHLLDEATRELVRVDEDGVAVVDVAGTDGYRPCAELARAIVDRDRTCRFPGCRVQAARCDIDHVEPFDPDRPARWQTVEQNLQALCRHHHRLKTHGGWYVSRDPISGATLWRSPTGRVYIVSLEPVLPATLRGPRDPRDPQHPQDPPDPRARTG